MSKRKSLETSEMERVRKLREANQQSMNKGLASLSPDFGDLLRNQTATGASMMAAQQAAEDYARLKYEREMEQMRQWLNLSATPQGISPMGGGLMGAWSFEEAVRSPSVNITKLDALKKAEPYKVEARMPDYVTVITAWRAWKVVNDGGLRLKALGTEHIWRPKAQVDATCTKRSVEHPAPQSSCTCGVWAFKELDSLVAAIGSSYGEIAVLGQVSLWGRVVETENGYRAEKAYPSELWILGDDHLEELGLIYDVPVRMVR